MTSVGDGGIDVGGQFVDRGRALVCAHFHGTEGIDEGLLIAVDLSVVLRYDDAKRLGLVIFGLSKSMV